MVFFFGVWLIVCSPQVNKLKHKKGMKTKRNETNERKNEHEVETRRVALRSRNNEMFYNARSNVANFRV